MNLTQRIAKATANRAAAQPQPAPEYPCGNGCTCGLTRTSPVPAERGGVRPGTR